MEGSSSSCCLSTLSCSFSCSSCSCSVIGCCMKGTAWSGSQEVSRCSLTGFGGGILYPSAPAVLLLLVGRRTAATASSKLIGWPWQQLEHDLTAASRRPLLPFGTSSLWPITGLSCCMPVERAHKHSCGGVAVVAGKCVLCCVSIISSSSCSHRPVRTRRWRRRKERRSRRGRFF